MQGRMKLMSLCNLSIWEPRFGGFSTLFDHVYKAYELHKMCCSWQFPINPRTPKFCYEIQIHFEMFRAIGSNLRIS